ncbi:cobalamin-independent methionine synthase II family protein [Pollutibacter soli]|uniref:cobalamin-independent methionine synthase II family protein n=1 Tax=Pollutibacter soli TaxID=3034157 RepID=UPI0030141A26
MRIRTEPIGSIPRPAALLSGMQAYVNGELNASGLQALFDAALRDTIARLEATGSPVITDGEQTKPSFATYPIATATNISADGVVIPFADGHTRQLPKLSAGPFRYTAFAAEYLKKARQLTTLPLKQAVISASALSLLYPPDGLEGYSREQFINDLLNEAAADIRNCFKAGAYNVQIDFTEARLSLKLDPSGGILKAFIDLNNQVLSRFSEEERQLIGVHSCPGGDHDSTHSADIPYKDLLPELFRLNVGSFYLEYAGEVDKQSVLKSIRENLKPNHTIFLGVTNVLKPRVESPEEIRDFILEASEIIPVAQLASTDDCGFSPFADDDSTAREIAFEKIGARVRGTALAEEVLSKKQYTTS